MQRASIRFCWQEAFIRYGQQFVVTVEHQILLKLFLFCGNTAVAPPYSEEDNRSDQEKIDNHDGVGHKHAIVSVWCSLIAMCFIDTDCCQKSC